MHKLIVFGLGKKGKELERYFDYNNVEIVAFSDNNKEFWGKTRVLIRNKIKEVPIVEPNQIIEYNAKVIIASSFYEEIKKQILCLGVKEENIINGNYGELLRVKTEIGYLFINNFWEDIVNYEIEGIEIRLPKETCLPKYQKHAPMYDKFFPYLAMLENRINGKPAYILDIGANVGDSLAAMIRYTNSTIITVEPTDEYFELLQENISRMSQYSSRIKCIKAYISSNEEMSYKSIIEKGTATKEISNSSQVPSLTIPSLIKKFNIKEEEVSLIKVDTDGYDAECIMSCGEMLKKEKPILYWENEIFNLQQYELFNKLIKFLNNAGYEYYFVFDNFGNYICEVQGLELMNINRYLMMINNGHSVRTFYYVDILACKKREREYCRDIIEEYLQQYPIE